MFNYIKINEKKRIIETLSSDYPMKNSGIQVENFPQNATNYKYIKGQFIYDPLPEPIKPYPQPTVEERLSDVELALADLYGGAV